MFNPIRIEYILEKIKIHHKLKKSDESNFLNGINILDIGCGGGLISEPMARLGAHVTGIDASEKNIKVAKLHSKKNNLEINYLNTSPENLINSLVFPAIAETITITLLPKDCSFLIIFATCCILSIVPTDVPPNFSTFLPI